MFTHFIALHCSASLPSAPVGEFAAVATAILALGLIPPVRKAILAPARRFEDPIANVRPMGRGGIMGAYIVIALILGGSIFDMVRDTEHWPWSNFPMYSRLTDKGASFEDYRLYGIPKGNPGGEFGLATDGRFTQPFDQSRLAEALAMLAGTPDVQAGLADCLRRYEVLRQAGEHGGPELAALRLYRVSFQIDPYGRNTENPQSKTLIGEV